ncbi:hypothetical protein PISMIDRAFT_688184 [Pisolithus microcarpus 441]|uniref:Uncharacterized protein n=1 Tax=Pisolithus microcarpus 441 TaxID=765257 RepID=A0A0C9XP54_9AGAM|nr:hypothetical protein PISMIDRAFT_688184 [Pisolithus microcarpus 441]
MEANSSVISIQSTSGSEAEVISEHDGKSMSKDSTVSVGTSCRPPVTMSVKAKEDSL